jgi:hypothetical protein
MVALEAQKALVSEVDPFFLEFFEGPLRGRSRSLARSAGATATNCAHWPARR